MKPLTRRGLLRERVALYERLAEVDAALIRVRLRWDAAEARYRDAAAGAFAVADLAEKYRAEREAARTEVAVLAHVLDDVRGRCAEVRALHEDCDDPRHQGQAAIAEELLKTIGDPDEPEQARTDVPGAELEGERAAPGTRTPAEVAAPSPPPGAGPPRVGGGPNTNPEATT